MIDILLSNCKRKKWHFKKYRKVNTVIKGVAQNDSF